MYGVYKKDGSLIKIKEVEESAKQSANSYDQNLFPGAYYKEIEEKVVKKKRKRIQRISYSTVERRKST